MEESTDQQEPVKQKRSRNREHADLRKNKVKTDVRFKKIIRTIMWILRYKFNKELKKIKKPVKKALKLKKNIGGLQIHVRK